MCLLPWESSMQCAILSPLACLALQYFSTLSHIRHNFRKKLLNIKCMFLFSLRLLAETALILRRNERDVIKNVYRSSCKVPDVNEPWNLSTDFRKILQSRISRISVQWAASCSMQTDRQTHTTKLIVAFRNSAKSVYQDASSCATPVLPTVTTQQSSYVKSHHNQTKLCRDISERTVRWCRNFKMFISRLQQPPRSPDVNPCFY